MKLALALSPGRKAVLAAVKSSGATKLSPMRLHGADLRAGNWLAEHGLLARGTGGFYPLQGTAPQPAVPQARVRKWTASGSHLTDPDGFECLDLPGQEKFVAKVAAALNAYDKLPRTP